MIKRTVVVVKGYFQTALKLPESIMETCSVVLTFESVDEILWCDHSNETSSAVLWHGTICFSIFAKSNLLLFLLNFDVWYSILGVKGLMSVD